MKESLLLISIAALFIAACIISAEAIYVDNAREAITPYELYPDAYHNTTSDQTN
jgi:hypothetical protein